MMNAIRYLLILLLASLGLAGNAHAGDGTKELVLVSMSNDGFTPLAANELRKLFLGLVDTEDPALPLPVGNRTDNLAYEVFLQKVVFMSARNYERLLLNKVFKVGNHRLSIIENSAELIETMRNNPRAVSYMWRDEAAKTPGMNVVQTIWEGKVE